MMTHITIFLVFVFYSASSFAQYFQHNISQTDIVNLKTDYTHIPKKPGLYTAEDWKTVIDTTWGEGLSTPEKLEIFDKFWNDVDQRCISFINLDLDWNELKERYRPEIENGVSRGRFAAIMNQFSWP